MFLPKLFSRLFSSRRFRRLRRLKRSPKLFIPTPQKWLVVPYKPLSALVILVLIICSAYLAFRSDIFLLRDLEFKKQNEPIISVLSENELRDFLNKYVARSMFFLKERQLEKDLTGEFLALLKVKLSKRLPDKLVVGWTEREPAAVIVCQGEKYLVDSKGLVYSQASAAGQLPEIYGLNDEVCRIKETLSGKILNDILLAVDFFNTHEKLKAQKISLVESNALEIISPSGWKALFSLEKEILAQLDDLLAIVIEYQTRGENFSEIDLRFKFPVVR